MCDDTEDPDERRLQMGQADALEEEREVLGVLQSPEKCLEGASLPKVRPALPQPWPEQPPLRPVPQRHHGNRHDLSTPPVMMARAV